MLTNPELMQKYATLASTVRIAESALGENLVWLADALDLKIRQKDPETLKRLAVLNAAWTLLAKALPATKP